MKKLFQKLTPQNSAVLKLTAEIDRRVAEVQTRGIWFSCSIGVSTYTISCRFPIDRRTYSHDTILTFKGRSEVAFWSSVQWQVEYCLDVVTDLALKADHRCGGR